MHDYSDRWQSGQFITLTSIPEAWAGVVLDHSENYLCQRQDQPILGIPESLCINVKYIPWIHMWFKEKLLT